ncbi:hypothetical protein ABZ920_20530 [Streptomyces sp. NPDC046831]|uniref:hypothetical protein n=1 Tax=Streptomyces sp. NPDC046831 TaxID=3154805 RepID=UPI0033FEBBDA
MATALLDDMDIAEYLAVIDRLCARDFPAAQDRFDPGSAGPGYFIAELATRPGRPADDAAPCEQAVEDAHALKEAVSQVLDIRRGRHQPPWSMLTLRVRAERGEQIPEPWSTVSVRTDEVDLWEPDASGRWVAVGVADRDEDDDIRLLAVVTETDPP